MSKNWKKWNLINLFAITSGFRSSKGNKLGYFLYQHHHKWITMRASLMVIFFSVFSQVESPSQSLFFKIIISLIPITILFKYYIFHILISIAHHHIHYPIKILYPSILLTFLYILWRKDKRCGVHFEWMVVDERITKFGDFSKVCTIFWQVAMLLGDHFQKKIKIHVIIVL